MALLAGMKAFSRGMLRSATERALHYAVPV